MFLVFFPTAFACALLHFAFVFGQETTEKRCYVRALPYERPSLTALNDEQTTESAPHERQAFLQRYVSSVSRMFVCVCTREREREKSAWPRGEH